MRKLQSRTGCCFLKCTLWLGFVLSSLQGVNSQEFQFGDAKIDVERVRLRTLDDHIPFVPPTTQESWLSRKAQLRRQLTVALGLDPLPPLVPLRPNVYGEVKQEGFIVRKVTIETLPGLFLTGSLFLPDVDMNAKKVPAVLSPHGHWDDGRMYKASDKEVATLLATGAERFESAARNHIQARCIQLARMGCVVFAYDMLGYADSLQIDHERAHRWGVEQVNPESASSKHLLFSPQAEMYGQSVLGIQTLHGFRAIEFIKSLEFVDPSKISITGASGGGTQSFLAAALSDELCGAYPAVMVSTGMQGGCTCENAPLLRINTGNVEIAALIAPRPLGLTAANDWTVDMQRDGFPQLQQLYELVGAKGKVELFPATHFPHNFNHVSRVAMYGWMNRLFGLGLAEPILERDFDYLERTDLTVWDDDHPVPEKGLATEEKILRYWQETIDETLGPTALSATDKSAQQNAATQLKAGWLTLTDSAEFWKKDLMFTYEWGLDQGAPTLVVRNAIGNIVASGKLKSKSLLNRKNNAAVRVDWNSVAAIRCSLSDSGGDAEVDGELEQNTLAIDWKIKDPLPVGAEGENEQSLVPNPRPAAAYTYGYNSPAILRKVGVLLAILDELHSKAPQASIDLYSQNAESFGCLTACLRRESLIKTAYLDDRDRFRFADIQSIRDSNFLPSALRFQDIPGLLASAALQSDVVFGVMVEQEREKSAGVQEWQDVFSGLPNVTFVSP